VFILFVFLSVAMLIKKKEHTQHGMIESVLIVILKQTLNNR